MRKSRNLRALVAAVAACGLARIAGAQTNFSTGYDNASVIEQNGPFASGANVIPSSFAPATSSGARFPSYVVNDISTAGIVLPTDNTQANPTDIVTAVSPTVTLTVYDDVFFSDAQINATAFFYMITDNSTPINQGSGSPLKYIGGGTLAGSSSFTGGLNGPGQTGGFAAGSTYSFLGTGIYNDSGAVAANPTKYVYNLTLPDAGSQQTVQNAINSGANIRIAMTTNLATGGSQNELSFLSFANTQGFAPSVTFNLTTSNVGTNNNSTLWVKQLGTNSLTVDLGRVIQAAPITSTLTVGNSGSDPTTYRMDVPIGFLGNGSNVIDTDPIAGGGTATFVVGLSAQDTNSSAGKDITGQVDLLNVNNSADNGQSDLNGSPVSTIINLKAHGVSTRFLDVGSNLNAGNIGKVLVGATGSAPVIVTTTNPVTGDFSTKSLVQVTVNPNITATPQPVNDTFNTGLTLGTFAGVSPNYSQTFVTGGLAQTSASSVGGGGYGTVTGMVTVTHSGVYGSGFVFKPAGYGGSAKTYTATNATFSNNASGPETAVIGEGLPGENNSSGNIFEFLQWKGYSPAALVANTASILMANTGVGTITNAQASDNVFKSGAFTFNLSLSATGIITGTTFNQNGWLQSGVSNGFSISANNNSLAGVVANTGNTGTFTVSTGNSGDQLHGTYTATMTMTAQNEQDIQGTSVNDLPAILYTVQGFVTTPTTVTGGNYNLTGGTYTSAEPITLAATATYTQTGGSATFTELDNPDGTAQLNLQAGTTTIGGGTFNGAVVNNSSLTVTGSTTLGNISGIGGLTVGTGVTAGYLQLSPNSHTNSTTALTINPGSTLDINNGTFLINFGAGVDPVATITSELNNAYNAGKWTGTSTLAGVITSSTAQTLGGPALAVGIDDGNTDSNGTAGPNQIKLKYTLLGDTNLDGLVNFTDLLTVVQNFNKAGTDWAHGNFEFGISTNFADLLAVVQNFNKILTPAGSSGESSGGTIIGLTAAVKTNTPVPEPGSVALLVSGAAGLLARRRRKQRTA